MMLQLTPSIPVSVDLFDAGGNRMEGLAIYVESGGDMSNDRVLVALDDGTFKHFLWSQCRSVGNATFDIRKKVEEALF